MSSLVHRHPDMHWWVFEVKKQAIQHIKQSAVNHTISILPPSWKISTKADTEMVIQSI